MQLPVVAGVDSDWLSHMRDLRGEGIGIVESNLIWVELLASGWVRYLLYDKTTAAASRREGSDSPNASETCSLRAGDM